MLPAISQDFQPGDVIISKNLKKLHRLNGPIATNVINQMEFTRSAEEFGANLRLSDIAVLIHVEDTSALAKNFILNEDKLAEFARFFRADEQEKIYVFFEHISKIESCDYHVTKALETDGDGYVSAVEYGTSFLISMAGDDEPGQQEEEIKIEEQTNMALHHVLCRGTPDFSFLEGRDIYVNVLRNWTELILSNEKLETAIQKIPQYVTNTVIRYKIEPFPGITLDTTNIQEIDFLTIVDLLMDIRVKRKQIVKDIKTEEELPRAPLSFSHHDANGLLTAVKEAIKELENSEGVTKKFLLEVITLTDLVILFIKEELHRILGSGEHLSSQDVELCQKTCFLLSRLHEKLIQGNYVYREEMLFAQLSTVTELDSLFTNTLVICFDYRMDLTLFKDWYSIDVVWVSLRGFDFEQELILQRLRGAWMGFGWINPGNFVEPSSPGNDRIYMAVCPENRNGRKRLFRCYKCQNPIRERSKGRLICDCGSFLEKYALYKCLRRNHIDWVPFFEEEEVKSEPPKRVVERPPSPPKREPSPEPIKRPPSPPKREPSPEPLKRLPSPPKREPSPEPPKRLPSPEPPKRRHSSPKRKPPPEPPKKRPEPIALPTSKEPLSKRNPVNIVFVGPKNSGKSTLINAMAYYCTHFHFSNVNHNIPQIPFNFTITDDQGREFVIQSKGELEANGLQTFPSDSNGHEEVDRTGHQPGRDHDFFWQRQYFRLFDTKGVESIDDSPEALADITDVLSKVSPVHGLCIIIPANEQLPDPNKWYFALAKVLSPEMLKKAYFIFVGIEDVDKCKNSATFIKFLRRNWINVEWDKLLGIDNSCFLYLCAKNAGVEVPEMKLNQKEAWWNARSHIVGLVNQISRNQK